MKTTLLTILLFLTISCAADETIIVNCTCPETEKSSEQKSIPEWLRGSYKSVHLPEAGLTIITESTIHLDLTGFETVYEINFENSTSEETEEYYKVIFNTSEFIFWRVNEPNMEAIKITYIQPGNVLEFGYFNKVN